MRRFVWALPAVLLVPILSGCAALSARSKAPDLPPMNVPPPPERLIEPTPEPLPEPVSELPAAPPISTASRNTSRPPVSKPAPEARPADPKPPETTPTAPQDPPPAPQPISPAAQLRTPQTADTTNAEKAVRATVARAGGLLKNVDYRLLNAERKKAYNDAQLFMQQAEDALKEGNLVIAQAQANKAETLAKELAGK